MAKIIINVDFNQNPTKLELRIPEVQPTVQEIIEKVKEKNAFYAQ